MDIVGEIDREPKSTLRRRRAGKIDFLLDDKEEMTYGRRIGLSLMSKAWYNPSINAEEESEKSEMPIQPGREKPSLEKAWAYFEHFSLPRHILDEKMDHNDMTKAEKGEDSVPTQLYNPITTPGSQLGDFGIGIGLYFALLRIVLVIVLICGLISSANIYFFNSNDYLSEEGRADINILLLGSAICTDTKWVSCPDCTCLTEGERITAQDFRENDFLPADRCQIVGNNTFVLKNDCGEVPLWVGLVNYATLIVMLLGTTLYLGKYLKDEIVKIDEDEQTAQDYSVQVVNPPSEATNPDEWRDFFKEALEANVVVCTCAIDNDLLVKTMAYRRECEQQMINLLDPTEPADDLNVSKIAAKIERDRSIFGRVLAIFVKGIPELYARLVALNSKVKGLAQLDYACTNVFLTFETEKDQRNVLSKLAVPFKAAMQNKKDAVADEKYLFKGEYVLFCTEPPEPNTIIWGDLNATMFQMVKSFSITTLISFVGIVVVFLVVQIADDVSVTAGTLCIAVFNVAFPELAKLLARSEPLPSESWVQTSMYLKIALFRWANTAIVITIITPFTDTLKNGGGLINKVYAQFFSEIVFSTGIQLVDVVGHLNRHFLAPRAKSQDAMNLKFKGYEWNLAERTTDMSKILFLCVFYCSIYPAAYLMCAFSIFLKYVVDRFSLVRTWEMPPQLGPDVAWASYRLFFPLSMLATAVMSSYYWSGFPFDNLCEVEGSSLGEEYWGNFTLHDTNVILDQTSDRYEFCHQDFFGKQGTFPFVHHMRKGETGWMSESQQLLTLIFGWSSVVITAWVAGKLVYAWCSLFDSYSGSYETVGDDQGIPFSKVPHKSGYIPQLTSPFFSYPLIACTTATFDEELFDWHDPSRPHQYYDLTLDAEKLLQDSTLSYNAGFSKVKCYKDLSNPSEKKQEEIEEKEEEKVVKLMEERFNNFWMEDDIEIDTC